MSKQSLSPQAQAALTKLHSNTSPSGDDSSPSLQDLLSERTLAMIGGAPKPEVDRLATAEQAHLAQPSAEGSPSSDARTESPEADDPAAALSGASAPAPGDGGEDHASSDDPAAGGDDAPPADDDEDDAGPSSDSEPADGEADGPSSSKGTGRFRFQNAEDRAVAQIAKAKGISLAEAARLYHGEPSSSRPSPAPAATSAEAAPEPAESPDVAQLTQHLAELEQHLDQSSAGEGLWNPRVAALVKQHSKTAAALEVARLAAERQAAAAQAFEGQRNAILADAMKRYPDLGNQDSALWKVAAQMAREAHDPQHPDHLAGKQVDAPQYFAEKAAALLKIPAAGSAPESTAQPSTGKGLPRPGPVSGTKQTLPPARSQTDQQKIAAAQAKTLRMIGGKAGKYDDEPGNALIVM